MSPFLVTGATGRQGGSTARILLEQNATVHALVRRPHSTAAKDIQAKGAKLFEGDSGNAAAISNALEGVTGVFFNPPYPGPDFVNTCETFIQTCAKHRDSVKTFVVSSATGTEKHGERVKREPDYRMVQYFTQRSTLEMLAKQAGFENLVILRPAFLIHGYLPPEGKILFPDLAGGHKLITALKPGTKVPHLLAEDVGKFAAAALLKPGEFSGHEINLAAENLTVDEIAGIIGEVAGTAMEAPIAEFDGSKSIGVSSPVAGYHEWANEVDASVDVATLTKAYGIELTTLSQYIKQRKEDLMTSLAA